MKSIRYYVDRTELQEHTAHLTGWALSLGGEPLTIQVREKNGKGVSAQIRPLSRPDACRAVLGDESQKDCGFDIRFLCEKDKVYEVIFLCSKGTEKIRIREKQLIQETERRFVPISKMVRMTTPAMVGDDIRILIKKGPTYLKERLVRRYETEKNKYLRWLKTHLEETPAPLKEGPLVSILVPIYNTPMKFYQEMVESLLAQTYENWQLCLADGSTDGADRQGVLPKDGRITYQKLETNGGISENTNGALALAKGEWIGLLDHDDFLEETAIGRMMERALSEGADMIYSDEDKVSPDRKQYYEPHFKSDYNPDLLRSNNYICHFLMVKKVLMDQVGGFSKEYDGAQDYDLILRLSEKAEKIAHLPMVLYHWRTHPASTAQDPASKSYAFEAGRRALEAHLKRVGISGFVETTERPGYYRVHYESDRKGKISIIIPNKDEKETLRCCVESIRNKTDWPDYEIIIVENNSTTGEIFDYYKELEQDERIRVVTWDGPFNYSAINHFGVEHSQGEYLVLLNNDTEVISEDWLSEMAGIASRKEVGVVGAHLFYPDETVQHAGVVMKLAGCCGHVFYGAEKEDPGSYARAWLIQDYSAVTAACLMCRRDVWEEVKGLDPCFQVAYNDVDFCLRVRERGYLVVYTPYARLYHYESKTRGYEEGSEKQARFLKEQALLKERFPFYQETGDPYYNPNLTLIAPDFKGKYLHEGQ